MTFIGSFITASRQLRVNNQLIRDELLHAPSIDPSGKCAIGVSIRYHETLEMRKTVLETL